MEIINIPWEDVLFKKVLPKLSLKDLFNLRRMSHSYKILVDNYLRILKDVNLAHYNKFNNTAFKVLCTYCKSIRSVNLSRSNWLNEAELVILFKNNPNINDINLNYCKSVNSFLHLSVLNYKHLEKISLAGCSELTVGALETLMYHQHDVQFLDLSRCILLTEPSIIKLIIKFYNLRNLSLADIPAVTDRVISTIIQHCKRIENLNVDGCAVSVYSISKLKIFGPKIESIRAHGKFITIL